jgi:hypothetical protein
LLRRGRLPDKTQRETAAARRIFNLLPPDQAAEIRALWDEFEAAETPESKFANALDRLQPLMHNVFTDGTDVEKHGIVKSQVVDRNRKIADGAPDLWAFARELIEKAVNGHGPLTLRLESLTPLKEPLCPPLPWKKSSSLVPAPSE